MNSADGKVATRRQFWGLISGAIMALVIAYSFTKFDELKLIVARSGPWGPLAYILIKALLYIAAPLSGFPLQMAAGAIFGVWRAALYTLLGCAIGGSVNFGLARLLGRPILVKMRGGLIASRIDDLAKRFASWPELLLARMFFSPVYDFISYAAGLTPMPFLHYFIVSFVGGIVPTIVWAAFGASLVEKGWSVLTVSIGVLLFLLLSLYLRKRADDRNL